MNITDNYIVRNTFDAYMQERSHGASHDAAFACARAYHRAECQYMAEVGHRIFDPSTRNPVMHWDAECGYTNAAP